MAKWLLRACVVLAVWPGIRPLLPAADTKLELVVQSGHADAIKAVALSADGRYVVTGSSDTTAILWDAASGRQLQAFRGHTGEITSLAVSGDGRRLLTGSWDQTAILWDAQTGARLRTFPEHTLAVTAVALSADGRRAVTGSDRKAILWDVQTGRELQSFAHPATVNGLALSADGKYVLAGTSDDVAFLWDARTGAKLRTFEGHARKMIGAAQEAGPGAVAFGSDGRHVLTGSVDQTAILWDATTAAKLQTFKGHTGSVRSVALGGDGKRVLTGSADHTAILWDADGEGTTPGRFGNKLQTFKGHTSAITSVALSKDGQRVLTGSVDRRAILWDAATGRVLQTFTGHVSGARAVALGGDGKHILAGYADGAAVLWDGRTGQKLQTLAGHTDWVRSVALGGDGKRVLTGAGSYHGTDRTAILWDVPTGRKLHTFTAHTGTVAAVALSADGARALTGSADKTAILWDANSGDKLRTFTGHTDLVHSVALGGDEKRLLTGSFDKVILRDAGTGEQIKTFEGCSVAVWSADGRWVVTGSFATKTATLWDADTGKQLQTFRGHGEGVRCLALGGDGKRLLTGSLDQTAILWETDTGRQLQTFTGHTGEVTSAALGTDGRRVLTASEDGTLRLWDPDTGKELCRLLSLDAGKDWLVVTPDGLFDGSVNAPQFVSYRVAGTLEFVPLDRFLHRYYTPGLLARILGKGERPRAKVDVARALPPQVRLVAPAAALEVEDGKLEVKAEAEGRGDYPVTALDLLIDNRPYQGQKGTVKVADPKPGKAGASWQVELEPGKHTVKVLADTELLKGAASEEVEVRYVGGGAQVELPRLCILAVGISRYGDRTLNLDYADADARAVVDAYQAHSRKLFAKIETRLLLDEQATRRGILQGLIWLREQVKAGDYPVLYFAGHGEKDKDGALYFLPADVDARDLASTAISADDLKRLLGGIPGRLTAILDACHSGGIDGGRTRGPHGLTDDLLRDLIAEESGLVVLCATTGNEQAQESTAHKHGVFTQALLEGLAGKADANGDGVVYLDELGLYLNQRVGELSRRQQHPVLGKPTSVRAFPVSKP
jgi:WD40 repeat protein